MKTARERIKNVQGECEVLQDGDWGGVSERALRNLLTAPLDEPWPPAAKEITGLKYQGLTSELRAEYERLYSSMEFRWEDDHKDEPKLEAIYQGLQVEYTLVVAALKSNLPRYAKIAQMAGGSIPPEFIGILHSMEAGLSFSKHLHNGDPLSARTVQVPVGRPKTHAPPFTFDESAVDALTMPGKAYHLETDWSLGAMLWRMEGFNGYGYRQYHPNVLSPYLWSGCQWYTRGKYVADGKWDSNAVSKQLGTALLLRGMREA